MCLTCGCGRAHDNHGNSDYLTVDKLMESADYVKSAALDDLTTLEAIKNTEKALENDKQEHPNEY